MVGTRGGLSYRYKVTCLQVWTTVPACRPPASAAIVAATGEGDPGMGAFSGQLVRHASWQLTRLDTPMAVVSGTTSTLSSFAEKLFSCTRP